MMNCWATFSLWNCSLHSLVHYPISPLFPFGSMFYGLALTQYHHLSAFENKMCILVKWKKKQQNWNIDDSRGSSFFPSARRWNCHIKLNKLILWMKDEMDMKISVLKILREFSYWEEKWGEKDCRICNLQEEKDLTWLLFVIRGVYWPVLRTLIHSWRSFSLFATRYRVYWVSVLDPPSVVSQ